MPTAPRQARSFKEETARPYAVGADDVDACVAAAGSFLDELTA